MLKNNLELTLQNETRRVYDGMDVVQERDAGNNVIASYTRTGNIGGILARTTSAGSTFYGYDGGGNVTTLTNNAGAEVGSYTYDAWGNILTQSGGTATENPYRFSTKEQIGGLYSYGLRFYSPGLGRWINRDPIGEAGGTNLYMFAGNDPVNSGDEYGLWDWKKSINEWIFGSSDKPCIEDEWDEVGYASERRVYAGKKAAQSWRIGAEVVMSTVPLPLPKALPAARIPKAITAGTWAPNAAGKIRSFVTQGSEVYYRVYSGSSTVGGFLSKVPPRSAAYARQAYALPPSNLANMVQKVVVPAGTRLQRSRAASAFGMRGGGEQFQLLSRIPTSSFGKGVPLR